MKMRNGDDMDLQELVEKLQKRVAQLEATQPRRRRYNQQQAAVELGMSVSKLRQERTAGRISGTRNGRIWFFAEEEIQRYIAEQREEEDT